MIYQNDKDCLPIIQSVGCFVRSCGLMAEKKYNELYTKYGEVPVELTATQINDLWSLGKTSGFIDDEDNLINSAKLATYALRILGDNEGYFAEIATKYGDDVQYYNWAKKKGLVADSYIQKILQGGKSKYHFRLVDEHDNLIQDPHYPDIKVIKPIYTICYKYII